MRKFFLSVLFAWAFTAHAQPTPSVVNLAPGVSSALSTAPNGNGGFVTSSGGNVGSQVVQSQLTNALLGVSAAPQPLLDGALLCGDLGGGSPKDFAGGMVRLRSGVTTPVRLRKLVSSAYVYSDFQFVNGGTGNVVDFAAISAWGVGRDSNTDIEVSFYNQCNLSTPNATQWLSGNKSLQIGTYGGALNGAITADTSQGYNGGHAAMQGLQWPAATTPSMDAMSVFVIGGIASNVPANYIVIAEWVNGTNRRSWTLGGGQTNAVYDTVAAAFKKLGPLTQVGMYGVVSGATTYTGYLNGSQLGSTQTKSTTGLNITAGYLGYTTETTQSYTGGVKYLASIVLDRVASASDVAAIQAVSAFYTKMTPSISNILILSGESVMQGYINNPPSITNLFANQIGECLATPALVYPFGRSAATFANMQSDSSLWPAAGAGKNVAVTFGGYNDMNSGGLTPAAALIAYENLNSAAATGGFSVVATTGWLSNAAVSKANQTALYAGVQSAGLTALHAVTIADTWSNPDIGAGSIASGPWLQGDNLHFTVSAAQSAAQTVCQRVNPLFSQ